MTPERLAEGKAALSRCTQDGNGRILDMEQDAMRWLCDHVLELIAAAERPFVVPAAGITDAEGKAFDFPDATGRIERLPSDTTALERDRDEALAQVAALRYLLSGYWEGANFDDAPQWWREAQDTLVDTAAAARAHDERIHAAAIAEGRDYLAILCGVRHWKHVNADEAKTLAQAAQVIVNEYAEHFAVALDVPLVPPPTAAEPQP